MGLIFSKASNFALKPKPPWRFALTLSQKTRIDRRLWRRWRTRSRIATKARGSAGPDLQQRQSACATRAWRCTAARQPRSTIDNCASCGSRNPCGASGTATATGLDGLAHFGTAPGPAPKNFASGFGVWLHQWRVWGLRRMGQNAARQGPTEAWYRGLYEVAYIRTYMG